MWYNKEMLPSQHAVVGIIAAVLFYPIFGINAWMIAAAAVLIDVDHYFIYIYRKKSLNIKDAYWFFRNVKDGSFYYPIFHMVEIIVLEAVFVYYYPIFLPILIGQIIHVAQDWVEENFSRRTTRNFSFLLSYKNS